MGSIQVFPRKPPAMTIADVWRAAMRDAAAPLRVREARLEDLAALRALRKGASPFTVPLTPRQLESRRLAFPEGQLVAERDGRLAGAAASLIMARGDFASGDWPSLTGEGYFTTHEPSGETLLCAELVADESEWGDAGVARALLHAQRKLCRRLNLRRMIATAALTGYAEVREAYTPESYAMGIIAGDVPDAPLCGYLSHGFQYCGVLRDYQREDVPSAGHVALLVWLNPLYTPAGPPAFEVSTRARKCA